MNILFVSENYPPYAVGGAEVSTSLLAEWLVQEGHAVTVACSEYTDNHWQQNGVDAYPIIARAVVGTQHPLSAFKYAIGIIIAPIVSGMRIVRLINQRKIDAIDIIATPYYYIPIIFFAALLTRCRIFVDCRDYSLICPQQFKNDELEDPKRSRHGYACLVRGYKISNPLLRLLAIPSASYEAMVFNLYKSTLRWMINHGTRITLIPLSNYVAQQLILNGFKKDSIVVIPNISRRLDAIVPVKKFPMPTFAFGGRIEKEKGIWDLIAAVKLLRLESKEPFMVKIAGTGGAFDDLQKYLEADTSLPIELLGRLSQEGIMNLYQQSLAVVAPSRWPEPFGRFIQESISTGVPVIATAGGGITEGIKDGVNGILVKVGDYEAIAAAMKYFIDQPDRSRVMGAAMKAEAEKYDAARIGGERLKIYQSR